jgi:hypothetical protein
MSLQYSGDRVVTEVVATSRLLPGVVISGTAVAVAEAGAR